MDDTDIMELALKLIQEGYDFESRFILILDPDGDIENIDYKTARKFLTGEGPAFEQSPPDFSEETYLKRLDLVFS